MKFSFFLIAISLFFSPLHIISQTLSTPNQPNNTLNRPAELYCGTINLPNYEKVNFYMESQSTVWEGVEYSLYDWQYLITQNLDGPIKYVDSIPNNLRTNWDGFNLVNTLSIKEPDFGWGIYKFYCDASSDTFYIDYRDNRYGKYETFSPASAGHDADLWILLNFSTGKFKYNSYGSDESKWVNIESGAHLKIWEIKAKGTPITNEFRPYSPINLTINEKDDSYPILSWGHQSSGKPFGDDYITAYDIFRCVTTYFEDVPTNFSRIATVGPNITSYSDLQVQNGGWNYAYYKVKAINNNIESDFSNQVRASLISLLNKKIGTGENSQNKKIYGYGIQQNYPNPFNPLTIIRYCVKDISLVNVQVFDVLGNKITDLVNKIQPAGEYSITFDGSNLPNGIYIYKYQCGSYIEIKKMLLIK